MSIRSCFSTSLAVLLIAPMLITGCSSLEITSDYDRDADFASFKTYELVTSPEEAVPNRANDIVVRRLESSIENHLQAMGFSKVMGDSQADLGVAWHGSTKEQHSTTVDTYRYAGAGYGYGYYGWWGPGMGTTTVSHNSWEEGMLIIDFIDQENNRLVWRGVAKAVLSDNAGTQEFIDKVVAAMLKEYPGK
ncbi:MAG: DUF4136 domain-containing protein [Bacteroidetes bacterium]|nr:MAG: DUF4136 domain-containing protein [Bacteroidota bacterium]